MDYKLMVKRRLHLAIETAWQIHNDIGYLSVYTPFKEYYPNIVRSTYNTFVFRYCGSIPYSAVDVYDDEYGLYEMVKCYMDINFKVKLKEKCDEYKQSFTEN